MYSCEISGQSDQKFRTMLAVFDTSGRVRSILRSRGPDVPRILVLTSGRAVLSNNGTQVSLVDWSLRVDQILECPPGTKACAIFVSPATTSGSDFALCSNVAPAEICDFYRGNPALRISEDRFSLRAIAANPYDQPPALRGWRVGQSETWYFDDHGRLAARDSKGGGRLVSSEHWTPDYSDCTGELSAHAPHRFLAVCLGAHFYTDGALDNLFGYSRIALFDVASQSILAHINGPAYTWAALSPSGKLIAVLHGDRIRLYRVD